MSDGPYKEKYRKKNDRLERYCAAKGSRLFLPLIDREKYVRNLSTRIYEANILNQYCVQLNVGSKPVVIVSDIRRKTDIRFFRDNGYNIKTIRINADAEVRKARGWKFQIGVDDVQSECDLDDIRQWDLVIENDGSQNVDTIVDQILALTTH